jgi:hypothetical protein
MFHAREYSVLVVWLDLDGAKSYLGKGRHRVLLLVASVKNELPENQVQVDKMVAIDSLGHMQEWA